MQILKEATEMHWGDGLAALRMWIGSVRGREFDFRPCALGLLAPNPYEDGMTRLGLALRK